jgi:hypothetical protein
MPKNEKLVTIPKLLITIQTSIELLFLAILSGSNAVNVAAIFMKEIK